MHAPDPHSIITPNPELLMQLCQLSKCFKTEGREKLVALDQINLSISKEHHLIALIGPDGSGKSTLLQIMAGLLTPDSGCYTLQLNQAEKPTDKSAAATKESALKLSSSSDIGYMSQSLGLYEDISVWENLKLFSQLRDLKLPRALPTTDTASSQEKRTWVQRLLSTKRILGGAHQAHTYDSSASEKRELEHYLEGLLDKVGLLKFKDYKAGALSGGMKQKLALTCALSARPKLLLLDEPTVGVDPISRRELWAIIHDYLEQEHGYCLFSSLYLEEAERSSLTIFIKSGHIIYTGDAKSLKQQVTEQCFALKPSAHLSYQKLARTLMLSLPQSKVLKDICPRMGRIDLLTTSPDVTQEALERDLQQLFAASGLCLKTSDYTITERQPILEDAYINLTGSSNTSYNPEALSSPNTQHHDTSIHPVETAAAAAAPAIATAAPAPAAAAAAAAPTSAVSGDEVVIDVQGIRKQFGSFTAVHDSTFKVYKGEIFGLLGPNGAGKTTTFRMICALLNPSAGKILIQGLSLAHAKSSVRATIGYVAQKFCLYRKLTLRQNLNYFGKSYGLSGSLLQERVEEMCQTFALEPFLDESAEELPFGVQRSLSMACALIHKPSILFLDEATSGADPTSRRVFWQMISKLSSQGTTIIVTTHFMEEAEYCDRFLIQDQGKILILGTPDEICSPRAQMHTSTHDEALDANERISIEEAFVACVQQQRQGATTAKMQEVNHGIK